MELKIYSPQDAGFVQKIDWNFDELKAEVTEASQGYAMSVYTDDTIKSAKADRAKLNKFVDALKTKRTEIRKKLLEPDELFAEQINELVGIVQRAINNIDTQVKDYEKRQRDEKTVKIRAFYDENIYDLAEYLPFERVFRQEYANASTTMKSIKEEIMDTIQKVSEGIAVLAEVDSKYAGDMKEVFLRTYDIGAALAERNRLEEAEKRREEYEAERIRSQKEKEAVRKAEATKVMAAGKKPETPSPKSQAPMPMENRKPLVETVEDPVHVIDFRVYATADQLNQLKAFLKVSGIRYEPVPKQ